MTRTSVVPEASESVLGGATILPGVPLPGWVRPEEPLEPEPEPRLEAEPEAVPEPVLVTASVSAQVPSPPPLPSPVPVLEPLAPAEAGMPLAPGLSDEAPPVTEPERRSRHSHRLRRGTAAAAATVTAPEPDVADRYDDPIPQLAPPTPVPPRAEMYAAAGAAPPTAPWGTPPAAPVDLAPPTTAPLDVTSAGATATDLDVAGVEEDHDSTEPVAGSRRALVGIAVVGAVLVLGAVAAFVWPGLLVAQDPPAAAPPPAMAVPRTVDLAVPATAAGLTALAGAPATALAKAAAGTTLAGYADPVSAVYGTGTTPAATVIAWRATTRGARADVATAFAGYQGATGKPVSAVTPVDSGRLGGQMSCGSTVVGSKPASVCFWSDDATFGAVTVLAPTDAAAGATTAGAIRTAVEKLS